MPTTINVNFTVAPLVSTFILTSVLRSDNSLPPSGISLPLSLVMGSPVGGAYPWTNSFTDDSPPPYYNATATIDGQATPPLVISGVGPTPAAINLWMLANPSNVSILNAIRSDTNVPPSGVTFPISLTGVGQYWSGSFTDPAGAAPYYWCVATQIVNGVIVPFQFTLVTGVAQVVGFWTSQYEIEAYIGKFNADQLSNLNNSTTSPSLAGFANAIKYAQSTLDYELGLFRYPTSITNPPFPSTSFAFPQLTSDATILAVQQAYNKRGSYDENDQISGKYATMGKEALADIKMIVRNQIYDVNRGISHQPTIVLSPALFGFGNPNPLSSVSSSMIPTYPYSAASNDDIGPPA